MMIRQKLQENMDTEMGSDSLSRPAGGVPASLSEPLPRGRYALLRGQPIPSRSLTIILCDAFSGPVPVAKDILRESMPIVCGLQVPGNVSIIPGIYVETLGLSTVFLEEFCTESLTVSMS